VPRRYPLVALVILDGWGCAPPGPGNGISLASTPVFDGLWERYPHTTLEASGHAVGLPEGQMGNSEVGHLTIGSGRILLQDTWDCDLHEALRSVERIADLRPERLFAGHLASVLSGADRHVAIALDRIHRMLVQDSLL